MRKMIFVLELLNVVYKHYGSEISSEIWKMQANESRRNIISRC